MSKDLFHVIWPTEYSLYLNKEWQDLWPLGSNPMVVPTQDHSFEKTQRLWSEQ